MFDQAARLREIATKHKAASTPVKQPKVKRAHVIAIASGKGGVGKTNVAVNLALKLRETGLNVLLLDADINLANANILMGIVPKHNLADAIIKDYSIKEVIHNGPGGLHILPGGSGFRELTELNGTKKGRIFRQLQELERKYDYIIIDTAAGLNKEVLDFLLYAGTVLTLITPEPTSIADSYALIKVLSTQKESFRVHVVLNRVKSFENAKEIYLKFKMVIDKFLQVPIKLVGIVNDDRNLQKSVMKQIPLVLEYPQSVASRCIDNIAEQIIAKGKLPLTETKESFFEKLSKISVFN